MVDLVDVDERDRGFAAPIPQTDCRRAAQPPEDSAPAGAGRNGPASHHLALECGGRERRHHRSYTGADAEDGVQLPKALASTGTQGAGRRASVGASSSGHGRVPQSAGEDGRDGSTAVGLRLRPLDACTVGCVPRAVHAGTPEHPLGERTAALPRVRVASRQAHHPPSG
jgi:hypothetical protein